MSADPLRTTPVLVGAAQPGVTRPCGFSQENVDMWILKGNNSLLNKRLHLSPLAVPGRAQGHTCRLSAAFSVVIRHS